MNSHFESVTVQARAPRSGQRARVAVGGAGLVVLDDRENALYPLAIDASGRDEVFVGRLRRAPSHARGLCMWTVSDILRRGATLNCNRDL